MKNIIKFVKSPDHKYVNMFKNGVLIAVIEIDPLAEFLVDDIWDIQEMNVEG